MVCVGWGGGGLKVKSVGGVEWKDPNNYNMKQQLIIKQLN